MRLEAFKRKKLALKSVEARIEKLHGLMADPHLPPDGFLKLTLENQAVELGVLWEILDTILDKEGRVLTSERVEGVKQ